MCNSYYIADIFCRNELQAREGIDTVSISSRLILGIIGRNELQAREGIDTAPIPAIITIDTKVEMSYKPERALTPIIVPVGTRSITERRNELQAREGIDTNPNCSDKAQSLLE